MIMFLVLTKEDTPPAKHFGPTSFGGMQATGFEATGLSDRRNFQLTGIVIHTVVVVLEYITGTKTMYSLYFRHEL